MINKRQLLALGAIVVVAVAASIAAERWLPVVRVAENWSRDLRVATLTPPAAQSQQIAVVTITEDTLATFPYRSPLDRRFVSELLRSLERKRARLIALDMLLDQPSEADKDEGLWATLRGLSVPVVVASAEASDGLTDRQVAFMSRYLDGVQTGIPIISADSIDGTVRAVALRRMHGGQAQLSFVAAVADALGIRVPEGDSVALRFRGAPDAETPPFPVYPAHAVALLPDAWFDNRIVLVGVDLPLLDRHRTPFSVAGGRGSADMPGVILQAHALSQILEGGDAPAGSVLQGVVVTIVFAVIGAGIVVLGYSPAIKAVGISIAFVVIWVGGLAMFSRGAQLVPLVAPTLGMVLAALLAYAWRWREEYAQKRFIHEAFSKYVAPSIVDHMIANPEQLRLGGERRNITFVFTDIADYTTLTENTEPTLFVKIMNEYLDGTTGIVLEHGGTLEKFVGDALHVMFNAPVDQPDHAERAVACALALDAWCEDFVSRQRGRDIEFGLTRIGINTGDVVVGNLGGEKRFDYSATGDAINTAARLESVNKQLGTRVCISGTTIEQCDDGTFRPVGELVLKGKSESVAAFEPLRDGDKTHCSIDEYMAAYRMLSASDPLALDAFRKLAGQFPDDPLVAFHLGRLEAGESGSVVVLKEK
jgi:class 3 adenylate cyclase